MFQESEVQQFNRLYKELDDLYHEIALAMGLSDSAFAVMYVVGTLGDGCLQRDICREAYVSKQTVNSSCATWNARDICTWNRAEETNISVSRIKGNSSWRKRSVR